MKKLYVCFFLGWLTLTVQAQDVNENKRQKGKQELVSTKKEQIAKKWYLKRREIPADQKESMSAEYETGTYFDIKPSGDFEAFVLVKQAGSSVLIEGGEYGKWKFGKGNTSIIITSGSKKNTWKIKRISATELILINTNKQTIWVFSDKE